MSPSFRELRTVEEFKTTIPLLRELNEGYPALDEENMAREFIRAQNHDYRLFGVYLEENLIGTFSLSLRYNPSFFAPGCEINGLIIAKEHRSKGFGKKTMDFAMNWAKQNGAGFTRLFVHPDNEKAVRLYKSLGYRHTSDYMYTPFSQE